MKSCRCCGDSWKGEVSKHSETCAGCGAPLSKVVGTFYGKRIFAEDMTDELFDEIIKRSGFLDTGLLTTSTGNAETFPQRVPEEVVDKFADCTSRLVSLNYFPLKILSVQRNGWFLRNVPKYNSPSRGEYILNGRTIVLSSESSKEIVVVYTTYDK